MNVLKSILMYRKLNKHMYKFNMDSIENYQWKQVKKMVDYAKANSPYYDEMYAGKPIESLKDFSKMPTIDKRIMMEEFNKINTVGLIKTECMDYAVKKELAKEYLGYYLDKYVVGLSSGTSGNKGLYITPKTMTKQIPALFLARGGIFLKDLPVRILFLLRVFSQGFQDINAPLIKLDYLSTMTPNEEIIKKINDDRINILMAPPSLIRELLPQAKNFPHLKRIITYAEVLTKEEKIRFTKAFNTEIVEIYQASEGQIASPCRCGNLHINEDLVYVELFDEKGNKVSETGRMAAKMIVTNLINFTQPLIRYEMNDLIVLGEKCECGSAFRRIDHIIGRNDDVFRFPNQKGEMIAIYPDLISRWIITISDDIREFVATQTSDHAIKLIVDATASEPLKKNIQARFSQELSVFGIEINMEIEFSAILKPEGNKKMKRFIRIVE